MINPQKSSRLHGMLRHNGDSPTVFGVAMAGIAMLFILGIVLAFNNARLGSIAANPTPAAIASAPDSQATPETTGTSQPQNPRP